VSTQEKFTMQTKLGNFLDGKLWTGTNAVVPATNCYGIAIVGANNAVMPASQRIYDLFIEYMVEFRTQT